MRACERAHPPQMNAHTKAPACAHRQTKTPRQRVRMPRCFSMRVHLLMHIQKAHTDRPRQRYSRKERSEWTLVPACCTLMAPFESQVCEWWAFACSNCLCAPARKMHTQVHMRMQVDMYATTTHLYMHMHIGIYAYMHSSTTHVSTYFIFLCIFGIHICIFYNFIIFFQQPPNPASMRFIWTMLQQCYRACAKVSRRGKKIHKLRLGRRLEHWFWFKKKKHTQTEAGETPWALILVCLLACSHDLHTQIHTDTNTHTHTHTHVIQFNGTSFFRCMCRITKSLEKLRAYTFGSDHQKFVAKFWQLKCVPKRIQVQKCFCSPSEKIKSRVLEVYTR